MGYKLRRWQKLAGLGAIGVLALPATVSGQDGGVLQEEGEGASAESVADQVSTVFIDLTQQAAANSGWNLQINDTIQTNDTSQDASSSANGGTAISDAGEDPEATPISTGGNGGKLADSGNDATSSNSDGGGNSLAAGGAEASNTLAGSVTQAQTNDSTNTASSNDASVAPTAESDVIQDSLVEIVVTQTAEANSGFNEQVNTVDQANFTDQTASSSANGGDATSTGGTAPDSLGGDGGSASASNTSSSSNSAGGGNSVSTGDASASNSATIDVSQSSSNTSTNTSTFEGPPPPP